MAVIAIVSIIVGALSFGAPQIFRNGSPQIFRNHQDGLAGSSRTAGSGL
jgi:hypothetical protein